MRKLIGITLALSLATIAHADIHLGLGRAVAKRSAELIDKAGANYVPLGDSAAQNLPSCGETPIYSAAPVSLSDITGIVPLGNLNPPGHTFPSDHIYPYLRPVDPLLPVGERVSTNLYAPGDITVTDVASSRYLNANPVSTDYAIYFYSCRDVKSYFSHVKSLSAELSAKLAATNRRVCSTYSTGGYTIERCDMSTNFTLKAGDWMGTVGGPGGAAFDFGTYDYRVTLTGWANSSRHLYDAAHTVCPLDYFTPTLAQSLKALLGEFDGSYPRTIAPICGTTMQDVAGTAQGYWYKPGQPDIPEDPHLALVHSYVDPTYGVINVGTSVSGLTGTWYFLPTSSGTVRSDFNHIGVDGQTYCYDSFRDPRFVFSGNPTIILIELTSPTTLRIEKQSAAGCGTGPWSFTSAAVTFQR